MLRHYYQYQNVSKKYKLGVVTHMSDKNNSFVKKISTEPGVIVINALNQVELVLEAIASCSYIISSSLHGIIAADSFCIPNIPVVFPESKKNIDDSGKFIDYGTAISRELCPISLKDEMGAKEIFYLCDSSPQPNYDKIDKIVLELEGSLYHFKN